MLAQTIQISGTNVTQPVMSMNGMMTAELVIQIADHVTVRVSIIVFHAMITILICIGLVIDALKSAETVNNKVIMNVMMGISSMVMDVVITARSNLDGTVREELLQQLILAWKFVEIAEEYFKSVMMETMSLVMDVQLLV